jgi:hypothetical protein
VQWYGETVKLDLKARKIIERTGTKPERYRLLKRNANKWFTKRIKTTRHYTKNLLAQ